MKKKIALLALFAAQFAIIDVVLRHAPPRVWVASAVMSIAVWIIAASFAERRIARAVIAFVAAWLVVLQTLFFRYYHVFLDADAASAARHMWSDVRPVVVRVMPMTCVFVLAVGALEFFLLSRAYRVRPRARLVCAAIAVCSFFFVPRLREASPDVAAIASLRVFAKTQEAHAAQSVVIEPLASRRAALPNVLFILDESVRATDYDDTTAPETAALTKGRIDFTRRAASRATPRFASRLSSRAVRRRRAPSHSTARRTCSISRTRRHAWVRSSPSRIFPRRRIRSSSDVTCAARPTCSSRWMISSVIAWTTSTR